MIKQAQRTEHADFSLKRGTPMREKFRHTQENTMYYNGKVLLVKYLKASLADEKKLRRLRSDLLNPKFGNQKSALL